MNTADSVRNKIIDKLLAISDKKYLDALLQLVEKSPTKLDKVKLTAAQIAMLNMSEDDYRNGKVISQEQLDHDDALWFAQK